MEDAGRGEVHPKSICSCLLQSEVPGWEEEVKSLTEIADDIGSFCDEQKKWVHLIIILHLAEERAPIVSIPIFWERGSHESERP
jgi:hypothetical protein